MDDFLSRVLGVGKPKVAYDPEPPNEEEDSDNKQYDSEQRMKKMYSTLQKKKNEWCCTPYVDLSQCYTLYF